MCASEQAAKGLEFNAGGAVPHASTFGGNPLACAAASAVFDIMEAEGLVERAREAGTYLGTLLEGLVAEFPGHVLDARGRGLLRGVAVSGPPAQVTAACRELGMLVSVAGTSVVRFAPPYIVTRAQLDEAVAILRAALKAGAGRA
jgi:acetylornithine/succinyldiaminopimelate/putrescine aminotransferase